MAPPGVPARLSLSGIRKLYPGVVANDGIDLDVGPGEIHALLGENGAGKSTLVKIACGVTQPSDGQILWEGRPVVLRDPAHARILGIGVVFMPRSARVVELRFFAGLEMEEIASQLGVTARTVRNDWATARAWLRVRLEPGGRESATGDGAG